MSKYRLGLRPPRKDAPRIAREAWPLTFAGRAQHWGQWARAIKPADSLYPLARDARVRIAEALRAYRRGDKAYAEASLARIRGYLKAALDADAVARNVAGRGGRESAKGKKAAAALWQARIEREVDRRLRGRRLSNSDIATRVEKDAKDPETDMGPSPERIRRFVAERRKKLLSKK